MKPLCGALTKKGGSCGNGLGCDKHPDWCQAKIRARAMARVIPSNPVQEELFPRLTLDEVRSIVKKNILIGRAEIRPIDPCGCQGGGE